MADMVKVTATNTDGGPRIFNSAPPVVLQPGESTDGKVDIAAAELASMKSFGAFAIEGDDAKPDAPDYDRDGLRDVDLHKPSTTKDMLLVIAAYEGAEVPEGDGAKKADIISAIELAREEAAKA